jgi:hypothetical protein
MEGKRNIFQKRKTYQGQKSIGDMLLTPRASPLGQVMTTPSIIPYEDLIDASGS